MTLWETSSSRFWITSAANGNQISSSLIRTPAFLAVTLRTKNWQNHFLREGLTPLLVKHGCAAIIMHHTPKTQFNPSADFTTTDFMYRGAGCGQYDELGAGLSGVRAGQRGKAIRFVAAKRGQRIGWDNPVRFYRHSRVPGGDLSGYRPVRRRWIPRFPRSRKRNHPLRRIGFYRFSRSSILLQVNG